MNDTTKVLREIRQEIGEINLNGRPLTDGVNYYGYTGRSVSSVLEEVLEIIDKHIERSEKYHES